MKIQTKNLCIFKVKNTIIIIILYTIIILTKGQSDGNITFSNFSFSNTTCVIQYQNNKTMMNLGNCQQLLYYITVGIGSPPQYFNLQVSTGSDFVWVYVLNLNLFGFNQSESITFNNLSQPGTINFPNGGQVNGTFGIDYITFVNTTINSSANILFVNQASQILFPPGIVGVIGMGYAQPNILDIAFKNKQIQTNTFSLFLGDNQSFIMFSQLPDTVTSDSLYSQVVSSDYWQIQLLGFIAGDVDMTTFAAPIAEIDSGISLLALNLPLLQIFTSTFLSDQPCNNQTGLTICNCSILPTLPNIQFIFKAVSVQITPQQYVFVDNNLCYVNIVLNNINPNQIIIGTSLFRLYNITFNKQDNTIGFQGNTQEVIEFGTSNFYLHQFIMAGILIGLFIYSIVVLAYMSCINRETLLKTKILPQKKRNVVKQRITQDIAPLIVKTYSYD